jgi:hypothetical protein
LDEHGIPLPNIEKRDNDRPVECTKKRKKQHERDEPDSNDRPRFWVSP